MKDIDKKQKHAYIFFKSQNSMYTGPNDQCPQIRHMNPFLPNKA